MKRVNIHKVYSILEKQMESLKVPVVELIDIQTKDPFKVLLATMLSARTQDATTAKACKRLFTKVSTPKDLERISQVELQKLIYPVGFYRTKAKHLKQLPHVLKEKFNSKLPSTVEELIYLPGVGRKTANLVVAVGFHKPAIAVDIHVFRISNRLGYVKTKTPLETEIVLRKKLPKKYWLKYNMFLVAHGQSICRPITPLCSKCAIRPYCNRVGVTKSA
ncbi:endonuclease III [Candidatus Woesearchaeota archaeon]|nr:endonuclease III [Candidatus Woesearchaeota archaeon]